MRSRLFEKSAFCVLSHSIFKIHYRKSDKVIVYRLVRFYSFTGDRTLVPFARKRHFQVKQGPFSFRCRLDNHQIFEVIIGHLLPFQNIWYEAVDMFVGLSVLRVIFFFFVYCCKVFLPQKRELRIAGIF